MQIKTVSDVSDVSDDELLPSVGEESEEEEDEDEGEEVESSYTGQCFLQLLSQFCLAIARQVTETVLCVIPAKLLKTSGCFWCPVFHLPIQSNAWLLSYGRSTNIRAKSIWKNSVEMKNYLSTNSRKKINNMSKMVETMFITLLHEILATL